jgi:hypothetical protein
VLKDSKPIQASILIRIAYLVRYTYRQMYQIKGHTQVFWHCGFKNSPKIDAEFWKVFEQQDLPEGRRHERELEGCTGKIEVGDSSRECQLFCVWTAEFGASLTNLIPACWQDMIGSDPHSFCVETDQRACFWVWADCILHIPTDANRSYRYPADRTWSLGL